MNSTWYGLYKLKKESDKKKMTTPQYQSYGGTTVRTETSPASRLDVFKKPLDPDLLAKVVFNVLRT